jgi:hypothetical protein
MESETKETFEGWCIIELMGHRKLGGHVREQEIAGHGFIRLDVPDGDKNITQLYSPKSVYCISPVSEELARAYAAKCKPEPITPYELRQCAPELFRPALPPAESGAVPTAEAGTICPECKMGVLGVDSDDELGTELVCNQNGCVVRRGSSPPPPPPANPMSDPADEPAF